MNEKLVILIGLAALVLFTIVIIKNNNKKPHSLVETSTVRGFQIGIKRGFPTLLYKKYKVVTNITDITKNNKTKGGEFNV